MMTRQYKPIKSSKSNETLIAKLYENTEVKAVLDSGLEMGNIIPKAIVEKHNEMNPTEPIKLYRDRAFFFGGLADRAETRFRLMSDVTED